MCLKLLNNTAHIQIQVSLVPKHMYFNVQTLFKRGKIKILLDRWVDKIILFVMLLTYVHIRYSNTKQKHYKR